MADASRPGSHRPGRSRSGRWVPGCQRPAYLMAGRDG